MKDEWGSLHVWTTSPAAFYRQHLTGFYSLPDHNEIKLPYNLCGSSRASSCRRSGITISLNHNAWPPYKNKDMFCGFRRLHTIVWLVWGWTFLCCPVKSRGNTAAIIMASHADKGHHTSSAGQCGLKNLCCDHRGASVHLHVCASS